MAVRDRNLFAWQAYVITMAFVSVGLLLGMFFLWRGYGDLSTKYADSESARQQAATQFTESEGRVDRLLAMMGYTQNTPGDLEAQAQQFQNDAVLGVVETDYAEAMKLFPPNHPPNEKNLIKLPSFLIDTIRIRNNQIDSARRREVQMQQDHAAKIAAETKAREDAVAAKMAAEADLAKARQEHTESVARLNQEKDEVVNQYQSYRANVEQRLTTLQNRNNELVAENQRQLDTIQQQKQDLDEYKQLDFAAPQGEIVRVADGGRVVWINLGQGDGLRKGVPFSVIDESTINISEARPKAQLIVTRVIDEHLSAAELTSETDFRNPVITGDLVYSPAWRPGRKAGFALVGMMDVNGDNKDDVEQVKELIRISGGLVEDVMDTSGNRDGNLIGMSPTTSFLVLGTDLSPPPNASPELIEQARARLADYREYMAEARQFGISQISLDKLLGYLKTEGADRTIPLGNRIQSDNFPPRSVGSPPVSRGKVSEIFTPRRP